jgi:elongation factor G
MALKKGISLASPAILEPVMKLEVIIPGQFLGDVVADVSSRRGHIDLIETRGETSTIRCKIPLSETFGYPTSLRSMTQGRATHSMEFYQNQELPNELTKELREKATGRK